MIDYDATTDRLVVIEWSDYPDKENRKRKWGGHIGGWDVEKLDEGVWRVPNSVNIDEIHEALEDVIRATDQAVLTYPWGTTDDDASAMRFRVYGKESD